MAAAKTSKRYIMYINKIEFRDDKDYANTLDEMLKETGFVSEDDIIVYIARDAGSTELVELT